MDFDTLEKLLNLLVRYQSEGKPLQIHIDEDLVKILPFPRKFLLDLLSDEPISTFFRLSDDEKTLFYQNNVRLCSIDQNEGGSCRSSTCEQLHLCQNYLLNKRCSQFNSSGQCSNSHSLSTYHNENILQKWNLSSKNDQTFSLISRLIQLSLTNSSTRILKTVNGETISDQLIDQWLDQHKSLLKSQKLINSKTVQLTFDDDEVASMIEEFINQQHSNTVLIQRDFSSDLIEKEVRLTDSHDAHYKSPSERPLFGRGRGKQEMNNVPLLNNQSTANSFSRRLASNLPNNEKKFTFSQRLNSTQNQTIDSTNNESPTINENKQIIPSKTHFILRTNSTKIKEKSPNPNLIIYQYDKPFIDEHLCYLFGPGKEEIIEKDQCEIFPCLSSGYCRVKNIAQGKDIEKCLYSILPNSLNINLLQIPEKLSLIVSSAAAENVFQQNQIHYAIVSEPTKIQLNIEVIERQRSSLISTTNSSASSNDYEDPNEQSLSNNQFHINSTGSSINVISGDISQIPVDMMICISTSNNLRENILRRAGPKIESQYKSSSQSDDALLLDGGLTAARKILFVPWQTEVEQTETTKTQKSLSDLVKWCIEQAKQRNLKSISFPPIGTGQLGLDPGFVCEAMISAANERLHQYKIDVSFVIYPSTEMNEEDECYQVFRIYLDSLSEQIKIPTATRNKQRTISKNIEIRKESIRREIQSKRILILSDSSKRIKDQNTLIRSLEDLIYEKSFHLSLIDSSLIDQIDLLIDICLKCNVFPRLNLSENELILRGDRDSCFQCFFNLRQGKNVSQYSNQLNEKKLNTFISLKIDEALALGESNICLKDDEETISNIDLNKLEIRSNKTKERIPLIRKELNVDKKIIVPSSWSSSLLMIRTVDINKTLFSTLECFQIFEQTMSEWQIERIDSIENYPLYIHFMNNNNRNERTKLYFHGSSFSSVQSIIHYGLHSTNASNYGYQYENCSICLTRDALNSHLYGTRRSTDGKYYLFAVQIANNDENKDFISLSNDQTCLALPTHLIVYQKRKSFH